MNNIHNTPNLFFSLKTTYKTDSSGRKTLGEGGGGRVDLIRHKRDPSQLFALKTIPLLEGGNHDRVRSEIDLHKSMNHPNIIRVFDSQYEQDTVYLFMEYADKGDLFKALHFPAHSGLDLRMKMKIFVECVRGVGYMHSKGILHRDLKLENILLKGDYDVKLCDFGWAVESDNPMRRRSMCGTVEYMAPEVFNKDLHTPKVDIWALGISLSFFKITERCGAIRVVPFKASLCHERCFKTRRFDCEVGTFL
jgi:aurora kinase